MKPETKTTWRRRTYIIDREFQYRYMTTWILMTLGFVGVNALVLYWSARSMELRPGSEIVLEHLAFIMRAGGYFVICLTLFLACLFLLMSHRIAGPAYRICKCLERLAKGDYGFDVRLRKRDYLKNVADGMNAMILQLRDRRAKLEALRELWVKALPSISGDPEGARLASEINTAFDALLRVEPAGEETKNFLYAQRDTGMSTPSGLTTGSGDGAPPTA
jgi:hypothetical protein